MEKIKISFREKLNTQPTWAVCLLLFFFLAIQIWTAITQNSSPFTNGDVTSLVPREVFLSKAILGDIVFFIIVQLGLYIFLAGLILFFNNLFQLKNKTSVTLNIIITLLAIFSILVFNQVYFPSSQFAFLPQVFKSIYLGKIILTSVKFSYYGLVLFWVGYFSIVFYILIKKTKFLILLLPMGLFLFYFLNKPEPAPQFKQPNIIIIGLDSVRPDKINKKISPNIYNFLNHSINFTNAYSPLARTFPAWVSMLTGMNPNQHGAQYNLRNPKYIKTKQSFVYSFNNKNYFTVYATDETRFSNITKHYGFKKLITPKKGLNDFLLGSINDFPLSNLIINTRLGRVLFPFNHANRAASVTYQPNSFVNLLAAELPRKITQPMLLMMHLCLPHWPTKWAEKLTTQPKQDYMAWPKPYNKSITELDNQFEHILNLLKSRNILQNSIVIIFSDHGEALGKGDKLITQKNYTGKNKNFNHPIHKIMGDVAIGHGTDLFSINQYHVLLALKDFRNKNVKPKIINSPVSLIDIKPTVLSFIKIKNHNKYNLNLLNKNLAKKSRLLYFETGINVEQSLAEKQDVEKIIQNAIHRYEISPQDGLVSIKDKYHKEILMGKQYGVLDYPYLLVKTPENLLVLINIKTGKWTDEMGSHYLKQHLNGKLIIH